MRIIAAISLALLLAACGGAATPKPLATPGYDLAHVKATWAAECADPVVVDADFCTQVQINAMTGDGTILNVPTTLDAAATDRADKICSLFTHVHFDTDGVTLGYEIVGILDKAGGHLAACAI